MHQCVAVHYAVSQLVYTYTPHAIGIYGRPITATQVESIVQP